MQRCSFDSRSIPRIFCWHLLWFLFTNIEPQIIYYMTKLQCQQLDEIRPSRLSFLSILFTFLSGFLISAVLFRHLKMILSEKSITLVPEVEWCRLWKSNFNFELNFIRHMMWYCVMNTHRLNCDIFYLNRINYTSLAVRS